MTQMRGLLALYWAETVVPPPPPPPEEICFPPIAAPVTAFSRPAMTGTNFSRGTVAGSFQRVTVQAVSGVGYGDDYGFDYGGTEGLGSGYSRGAIAGNYQRGALAALGAIRVGAPGASFARVDIPAADPGVGYGDDYGFDYGGEIVESLALPRQPVTDSRVYQRQAALSDLGVTRAAALGASFARAAEPDCVPRIGYGDDYGFNYGGE